MFIMSQCGPAAKRSGCSITALWWHNTQQANTVRVFTVIILYTIFFQKINTSATVLPTGPVSIAHIIS